MKLTTFQNHIVVEVDEGIHEVLTPEQAIVAGNKLLNLAEEIFLEKVGIGKGVASPLPSHLLPEGQG